MLVAQSGWVCSTLTELKQPIGGGGGLTVAEAEKLRSRWTVLSIIHAYQHAVMRNLDLNVCIVMHHMIKFCFLCRGSPYLSSLRENPYPHHFNLSLARENPVPVQISPAMRRQLPHFQLRVLVQSSLKVELLLMIPKSFLSSVNTSYRVTPPNGMCRKCSNLSALCLVSIYYDKDETLDMLYFSSSSYHPFIT